MHKYTWDHCKSRCTWYLLSTKTEIVEKFIFANLLRCVPDCISHIHMYFVCTNTVVTIVGVGVVCPPSKNGKCWSFIFAGLLSCIVDCINHTHNVFCQCIMSQKIVRVCVVSLPSQNRKRIFCWALRCVVHCINNFD